MRIFLISLLSLSLFACGNQNQADVKLAKGCEAGVNALIADNGKVIHEIKSKRFANEDTEGKTHRLVTLEAVEKEGWLELDKEYECLFEQQWGLFGLFHTALMVRITIDEETIGKKDGVLIGGLDDFMDLSSVVERAMEN